MPTFSVIVPVYNVEKYLHRCVQSILGQSYDDFELILVDDGSPDCCPEICNSYASEDSRVKVVHKENGGLCSARNAGLTVASGDYIFPVDSDDWLADGALNTIWRKAIAPYGPDAVIFNAKKVFSNHEEVIPCYAQPGFYDRERMLSEILPYMIWDKRQPFCKGIVTPTAWNKIYKRTILLNHYCTDERIRMGEDNAYVFECLYYSNSLCILDDVLYNYFQENDESITSTYDARRFFNNRLLVDYLVAHLGGRENWLDDELNAFKAYWLFMAIFHEARQGSGFRSSCAHLKQEIEANKSADDIDHTRLPLAAAVYLGLIRSGAYPLALGAAKLAVKIRG